jgi:hypothetical protein
MEAHSTTATEPKPEKKTADKRTYMREYKKRTYAENPDKIKELNRMYYAKYKHNISEVDCKKYGANLPTVIKLNGCLEQIYNTDKDLLKSLLAKYI